MSVGVCGGLVGTGCNQGIRVWVCVEGHGRGLGREVGQGQRTGPTRLAELARW